MQTTGNRAPVAGLERAWVQVLGAMLRATVRVCFIDPFVSYRDVAGVGIFNAWTGGRYRFAALERHIDR